MYVMKLPLFFNRLCGEGKSAAISNLAYILTPSSRFYIILCGSMNLIKVKNEINRPRSIRARTVIAIWYLTETIRWYLCTYPLVSSIWWMALGRLRLGKERKHLDLQRPPYHEAWRSTQAVLEQTDNEIDTWASHEHEQKDWALPEQITHLCIILMNREPESKQMLDP